MKPVLFTIGSFNVYTFGFLLGLAFLFSTFIVWKYGREELKEEEYLDAYLYTSIAALIFARATYIALHFTDFGLNILKYIVVREAPGLSLLGGFLGGFVFLFWYSKKKKENFLKLLDLFAVAASFALVASKIGEQLGGAGFGKETNFFLGVKIAGLSGRRHPVELYEAVLFLILTVVLIFVYHKIRRNIWPTGLVCHIFAVALAAIIFVLEFLKVYPLYLFGMGVRQVAALIILVAVGIPFVKKFREAKRKVL